MTPYQLGMIQSNGNIPNYTRLYKEFVKAGESYGRENGESIFTAARFLDRYQFSPSTVMP
jgi:hypothetical protein